MDQIDMDVEESRRILLDPEDDNNNDEDEDVSLTKDEEEEKNNIVKLSSYNFSKSPTSSSRSNGKSLTRGMSFQPSVMDDDSDAFGADAFNKDDNDDDSAEDETDDDYEHGPTKKASQMYGGGQYSEDERDDENDDEDDDDVLQVEGVYDPREFDHLNVNQEISSIFSYIQKYKAQTIILDYKLKPFIPDYIPAVGDIDAFLKVTTPDESKEKLGLIVLDEPQAGQSDPNVLDLQLRALTKHSAGKTSRSKKVTGGEVAGREVEKWIHDISDLHRSKPPPSVNYRHPMPDIDKLMQVRATFV